MKEEDELAKSRIEVIEAYLNNELTEETQKLFNQWAIEDDSFLDEIELHRQLAGELKNTDRLEFRSLLQEAEKQHVKQSQIRRFAPPRLLRIAAAIIVMAAIASPFLYYYMQSSPDKLFKAYYASYETSMISRGENEAQSLDSALIAYENKDFSTALITFQRLLSENKENDAATFFCAMCQMELGDFSAAINLYNKLIEDANNLFVEQSHWYISLAYLKLGDLEKAKAHLKILQAGSNPYSLKAEELISQL